MKRFVVPILVVTTIGLASAGLAPAQTQVGTPGDDESADSLPPPRPPRVAARPGGEGAEGDDATARLLWQRREFGTPGPDFRRKLFEARILRRSLESMGGSTVSAGSGPAWIPIGPEGADYETNGAYTGFVRDSGRARKFLPHPTDPDTLYVLTSGGGLWVTHNFTSATTTWTPLTENLPTTAGGSVAFGRTPNVIYLGLGDPFDAINIGGAMVKSTDGGQTWGPVIDLGNALSVRDILVDTSGVNDIVLVATDDGLYRSVDGGASYTRHNAWISGVVFWSLVQTSAGIVLDDQTCSGTPADFCRTISAMNYSTDHGATWVAIPNNGGVFANAGRTTLAVGAAGDSVVYAFAENSASSDQLDLFRSTDGGLNWTALAINSKVPANSNSDNPNMDLMKGQCWYNQMLLVDPRDATRNTVYLGGQLGSAKTTDAGATWTLLSNWLPFHRFSIPYVHADFHTAALTAAGVPTLLFGTDGGIFVSTDNGASWSSDKNNGLQTHLVYSLTGTPGFPTEVMGGLQDNGTRVRSGNTKIYNESLGGDGVGVGWSQGNTNMSVTTVSGNGYAVNLTNQIPDLIASWYRFGAPLIGDGVFATPVTFPSSSLDPTGRIFYSSSGKRVDKFDMNANTYLVIGQVGSGGIPSTSSLRAAAHSVGVSPVDLLHVGVPAGGGRVELTADGGTTWTEVSLNAAVPGFQSFAQSVTWVDNQTIFVTSVAPTVGAARVAKSINGGGSWFRSDTGLPDVQVERVVVDPRDATNQSLFAATYAGVYRSTDGGANWAPYGTGLPGVAVRDVYVPPDGSFVRIATYGRGFWELPFLSYVASSLADDVNSCDQDGALDNRETGRLTVTLHNGGSTSLTGITGTVTCSNPALTFPSGNAVSFPAAGAATDTTASVSVGLNGAVGIQRLDFTIAFNDPALGLAGPVTASSSFRANADELPSGSANDDIEASTSAWTVTGLAPAVPDLVNWKRIQITPTEHRWLGIDSNTTTDQALVSPVMSVGGGNFSVSYENRFSFDYSSGTTPAYYDGMVLELSTDNGGTWSDIGSFATPGYNGVLATGDTNVLGGRSAYVATSANYPTTYVPTTVNLGTAYAGQNVRLRFRIGTDSFVFQNGVELRNITTTGLANAPFTATIPDRGLCPPPGEVQNQRWTGKSTVAWDHEPSAGKYELYRDLLSTLPGGFGACLQSGIPTESASDPAIPPAGAGWFYLVTVRNGLREEGSKGNQSSGAQRPNSVPCP